MKKLKKLVLILVLLVVILGLAAVVLVGIFLDQIVKKGVETAAPAITQTTVTLDGVGISILSGSVSLKGLVVGNPAGYKTPFAFSLGKAALSVVPNTLLADKVVIHSIEINAPEITFEGNPFGANNLSKLLDNVNGTAAATPKTPAATPAQPAKSSGAAKKLQVDDFVLSGAKVHATLAGVSSIPGMEGKDFTIPIPDIHFSQLGTGPEGITAADLTQKVLSEVSADTIKAVADYAKTLASGVANDAIKNATEGAQKAAGAASGAGADAVKKGLGGILGK